MASTIEKVISEKGFIFIKPKGTSMLPLLNEKKHDVCIVKAQQPLEKYDVALYKRPDGTYVLHRVMSRDESGYVMCGDNQWVEEHSVAPSCIIGRLDSWYENNRKHTVRDASYLRYVRFWCMSLRLRHFMIWSRNRFYDIRSIVRAVFRKIFRRK